MSRNPGRRQPRPQPLPLPPLQPRSSLVRHQGPSWGEPGTAPYNFVPLPQQVLFADLEGERPWQQHHQFLAGHYSGWIDLDIETLTPLFTRGARQKQGDVWGSPVARLRPDPYTAPDGRPAIPGSSLRGMVRNLVEILTFAKLRPVTKEKLFYRSVGKDRAARHYRQQFVDELGKVRSGLKISDQSPVTSEAYGYRPTARAGIVRVQGSRRTIVECDFARVDNSEIELWAGKGSLYDLKGKTKVPKWRLQQKEVFVRADQDPVDYFFASNERHSDLYLRFQRAHSLSSSQQPGTEPATLVLTGPMTKKHLEFAFLTGRTLATVEVPDDLWERFHDPDQISGYQEKAFPKGQPKGSSRRSPGHLRDGEPVFFLCDPRHIGPDNPSGLLFFGRAQMFRFPYPKSPRDLLPAEHGEARLDMAEALFGRVVTEGEAEGGVVKGRLTFKDALMVDTDPEEWFEELLVPKILSSPNPTSYQLYLTQDGSKGKNGLTTYFAGDRTSLRGHKLYWHRWNEAQGLRALRCEEGEAQYQQKLEELEGGGGTDTQHTLIRPLRQRKKLSGQLRFDNLTQLELGALLTALDLPTSCAHKIGMAKALGLGSIRVTPTLHLIQRSARYSSWAGDGAQEASLETFKEAFAAKVLEHACTTGETFVDDQTGLRSIARLDALFHLLEWESPPAPAKIEQMKLSRFEQREVLATPHAICQDQEPPWSGPLPEAGPEPAPEPRHPAAQAAPRPRHDEPPQRRAKVAKFKEVNAGQEREGSLVRTEAGWGVAFEGEDRIARIDNPSQIPAEAQAGQAVWVYVRAESKKKGIAVRIDEVRSVEGKEE